MQTITVELGAKSYPIHLGIDLISDTTLLAPYISDRQVLIVSNTTVGPLYYDKFADGLRGLVSQLERFFIPDGEQYKTLDTLQQIYTVLLEKQFDRNAVLIALGGGVVGDITGFAAATYQRGINFIQIPTTLLAQVDSAVGGKTAVNHPLGKNMIGAFHQPICVCADLQTLQSLPQRELSAGLAEIIKYGLIQDREFFIWLERHIEELLLKNYDLLQEAVSRSCQNKAKIVAVDEYEKGKRALLNLGHTFGHAIETFTNYQTWLHGEAVAVGLLMAAEFSEQCGYLSGSDVERIRQLLQKCDLPIDPPPTMRSNDFFALMARDKKVSNNRIALILLNSIGQAMISLDYDKQLFKEYLEQRLSASA